MPVSHYPTVDNHPITRSLEPEESTHQFHKGNREKGEGCGVCKRVGQCEDDFDASVSTSYPDITPSRYEPTVLPFDEQCTTDGAKKAQYTDGKVRSLVQQHVGSNIRFLARQLVRQVSNSHTKTSKSKTRHGSDRASIREKDVYSEINRMVVVSHHRAASYPTSESLDVQRNIQRLFSKGLASPFDITPDGDTALHFAALSGNPELVAFLLYNGADAHVENTSGENALHLAMISPREEEHVELARLLVEKGQVDPMGSVRQSGVVHSYAGPVEAFRYLIHQDEFLVDPEERNRSGRTILHHQIFHRLYYGESFERIQVLFAAGHHLSGGHIDGDPIYDGYSALHCAAHVCGTAKLGEGEHTARQSELVLRRLLTTGEDIHRISSRGYTALTTIGEMIHFCNRSPALNQEIIAAWLNLLSEAGHDVEAYCLTECTLERKRQETSRSAFPKFLIVFEKIEGVQRLNSMRISISSLEQVIEVEDEDEEAPKIESTRALSSHVVPSFRERRTDAMFPNRSVSLGLGKQIFAFVMFILFILLLRQT